MTDNVTTLPVRSAQDFPLPDDLRCLALEYSCRVPKGTEGKDINESLQPVYALAHELDGRAGEHNNLDDVTLWTEYTEGKKTIFGTVPRGYRYRVNVIGARADIERWLKEGLFREDYEPNGRISLEHSKILDYLPTEADEENGFAATWFLSEEQYAACPKISGDPDPVAAYALLKQNWDQFVGAVRKWARTDADLAPFQQLKTACRGDLVAVGRMLARHVARRQIEPVTFLVDGLVPNNNMTLLLGASEVGKGALLLQLACYAAMEKPDFLGQPLNAGSGLVVFLHGEDSPEEIKRRATLLCGGPVPARLITIPYDSRSIKKTLEDEVGAADVDLVVIDPARKYLRGDEDSSDPTNTLFNEVADFIEQKHSAAVIAHHLKRYAKPRSLAEVKQAMRGSQVFWDRPRVVLGVYRIGDVTTVGLMKHNLDEEVMISEPLKSRRDPAQFRHVLADGAATEKDTDDASAATEDERVLAALTRLTDDGQQVKGTRNLFDLAPPELQGMSRRAIERAVKNLKEQRLVVSGTRGELIVIPPRP
jgi:hypothetical protein